MSDRTELPSPGRRSELRARGIVPYSALSTRAVGAVMFLVALGVGAQKAKEGGIEKLRSCFEVGSPAEMFSVLSTIAGELVVIPALLAMLGAFAWGLFQTRVLVHPAALAPTMSNLRVRRRFSLAHFLGGVALLGVAPIAVIGGALLLAPFGIEVMGLSSSGARSAHLALLYRLVGGVLVGSLVVLTALGWLASRVGFALRYRMTRQEIQQENRE